MGPLTIARELALGVYVACEDLEVTEALSIALERAEDLFLSPTADRADVVIATPPLMEGVPPGPAVVVLASPADPLPAAREAIARGAQGVLGWPADEALLSLRLHDAASRRALAGAGGGRIVSVVGARGGAGATMVAAYLARAMDALLVDLAGGPEGQAIFAPSPPPTTLETLAPLLGEIGADAVTRAAHEHAAGVACLYGGGASVSEAGRLVAALREAAPCSIVDGPLSGADVALVVVGADVGSVRAAASAAGNVVLNRTARGRLRAADVERSLGRAPVAVLPEDARAARAADLGRLASRGAFVRPVRRLAGRVHELLA